MLHVYSTLHLTMLVRPSLKMLHALSECYRLLSPVHDY